MANTIQLKRGTGSSAPSSLAEGELAINLDSGKLFYGSGSSVLSDFKFDKITAETYVISSSVSVITTSFSSGSTAFGDSAGDTHTFTGDITASGDISASGNIHSGRFIEAGANISSVYSPIAGHANIVTVGTITNGTWNAGIIAEGKLQNQSGTNTGDETTARVNALNITEVGALDDGTIASGFGTINSGEITATSIKHSISGNNAGEYGPGAEILYGISNDSTTAGGIYVLRSGTWTLMDADGNQTFQHLCAVAVGGNSSTNGMLIRGCVTLAAAYTAGTDGEGFIVYASETAGQATITAPSDSGDKVRILGYSLNVGAKKMFFNPDSTYVEIA